MFEYVSNTKQGILSECQNPQHVFIMEEKLNKQKGYYNSYKKKYLQKKFSVSISELTKSPSDCRPNYFKYFQNGSQLFGQGKWCILIFRLFQCIQKTSTDLRWFLTKALQIVINTGLCSKKFNTMLFHTISHCFTEFIDCKFRIQDHTWVILRLAFRNLSIIKNQRKCVSFYQFSTKTSFLSQFAQEISFPQENKITIISLYIKVFIACVTEDSDISKIHLKGEIAR